MRGAVGVMHSGIKEFYLPIHLQGLHIWKRRQVVIISLQKDGGQLTDFFFTHANTGLRANGVKKKSKNNQTNQNSNSFHLPDNRRRSVPCSSSSSLQIMLYSVSKAQPRISESDLFNRKRQMVAKTRFFWTKKANCQTKTHHQYMYIPVSLQYVDQVIHCLCTDFHAIFLSNMIKIAALFTTTPSSKQEIITSTK